MEQHAMKETTNANEMDRTVSEPAKILVGAGQLRALMWKPKGRWQVAIVREDEASGKVGNVLNPEDIISLAELATLIAQALYDHADLGDAGLSDDLGCLGHDLAKTLGLELESTEIVKKPTMQ
jgi:hypothetical protein